MVGDFRPSLFYEAHEHFLALVVLRKRAFHLHDFAVEFDAAAVKRAFFGLFEFGGNHVSVRKLVRWRVVVMRFASRERVDFRYGDGEIEEFHEEPTVKLFNATIN